MQIKELVMSLKTRDDRDLVVFSQKSSSKY